MKMVFRLLPFQVYLKINLSQNVTVGNMGSTASFEVSCGFVSQKSMLELLRAIKVEILDFFFFFLNEKLFVRKQKAFNCFPPKGFCSQT